MTAGVAIVGASVIAATPVIPVLPDVQVPAVYSSSAAVELTAAADRITAWVNVVGDAFENASLIGESMLDNPAPAARQAISNMLSYGETYSTSAQAALNDIIKYLSPDNPRGMLMMLQKGFDYLSSGNTLLGLQYITSVVFPYGLIQQAGVRMLPVLNIPGDIAQNVANVVNTLAEEVVPVIGFSALGTISGLQQTFPKALAPVIDAIRAGDPVAALGALAAAPSWLVNTLLNGGEGTVFNKLPGLLTPFPAPGGYVSQPGLIANFLVRVPRMIATALGADAQGNPTGMPLGLFGSPTGNAALRSAATDEDVVTPPTARADADTTPEAPARAGANQLTSGVTDALKSITGTATPAAKAATTVTLTVDPKLEAPTAGENSAADDTAGDSNGSTTSTGGADTSADSGTDSNISDASNAKADKESKKPARTIKREARQQARAQRQQVKKEAKAEKSTGGKHRADKGSDN